MNDDQLLREYSEQRSESAFAELVRRQTDFVYSAALRMVRDADAAKDVTQGVFIALAKNARSLAGRAILSGWLHTTAQYLAAKVIRSERRRRLRERDAAAMHEMFSTKPDATWECVEPYLDRLMSELSEPDRDVLLLRYFESKSARQMAQILEISDEAAQKRVTRAVDRLRECFAKRGIYVGAGALAVLIAANGVKAAPIGLAAVLSSKALPTATAGNVLLSLSMLTAKVKGGAITTIVVAGVLTSVVIHQAGQSKVRKLDQTLQQQTAQFAQRKAENERLSRLMAVAVRPGANNRDELVRMQIQVDALRNQTNAVSKLRLEAGQLQGKLAEVRRDPESVNVQPTVHTEETKARTRYCRQLALAAMKYALEHDDRYPTNLDQLTKYLDAEAKDGINVSIEDFEIAYTGSRHALGKYAHPGKIILIRQKRASKNIDGTWIKAYSFLDGRGEIISLPDGNFEAWERLHTSRLEPSTQ